MVLSKKAPKQILVDTYPYYVRVQLFITLLYQDPTHVMYIMYSIGGPLYSSGGPSFILSDFYIFS